MRKGLIIAGFAALLALFPAVASMAGAGDGIKERMKERLPEIVGMKAGGIVGENASGYLEFLPGREGEGDRAVVEEENRDRQTVYSAIAAQQGVSADKVGRLRALQIMDKALAGEYLKNEKGEWYRK